MIANNLYLTFFLTDAPHSIFLSIWIFSVFASIPTDSRAHWRSPDPYSRKKRIKNWKQGKYYTTPKLFCLSHQIFLAFKWHRFHFGLLFADAIFRLNVLLKAGHVDLADTIICRCSTRHPLHLNFVIGMEMYTLPRQQYQINLNIQRSSCTRHVLPNNLKVSPGMPVLMRFSFTPLPPPLPHPPRLHLASTAHESDGGERESETEAQTASCVK